MPTTPEICGANMIRPSGIRTPPQYLSPPVQADVDGIVENVSFIRLNTPIFTFVPDGTNITKPLDDNTPPK
jgi:hypothetical protein